MRRLMTSNLRLKLVIYPWGITKGHTFCLELLTRVHMLYILCLFTLIINLQGKRDKGKFHFTKDKI